jgi:hypothetical protein
MKISSFLKARNEKPHARGSGDSDSGDDEEGKGPREVWRRRENNVFKEWMDKRQVELQMVEDPEKTTSKLLDKLNIIAGETSQLMESKDVIDELNMARVVLEGQMTVAADFGGLYMELDTRMENSLPIQT